MTDAGARNPFRPGHGCMPPYLAGRECEQTLFREVSQYLRSGRPPRSLLFYGPRGNGKTALLRWAEKEADADCEIDVRWLVGSDLRKPADLVRRLRLGSPIESLLFSEIGVSPRPSDDRPPLAEALEARAKAKPLLILLDDAHSLEPEMGLWLLNEAQTAGRRAPFTLVLAGTPDLRTHISEMGAAFWSRARKLPVGRLDETAAAEAIRRPLADDGIAVEDEALDRIVRESHGYPFFVQLWGQTVWDRIRRSPGREGAVTTIVVEEAAGAFEAGRNDYYLGRLRELERKGLLPAAGAVAAAFRDEGLLSHAAFRQAIRQRGDDGPGKVDAAETLEDSDFVWQTRGVPIWEPGLPSLMDYLVEHAPPPDETDPAGR